MATVLESLQNGLYRAMSTNERVILMGEDILDPYGGAFKVTRGLSSAFPECVMATPISEAGFVGVAAGMALRGLRPVVEIMFGDFLTLAADALINHIAKFRWMYNEQVSLPLVIRTPMGGRRGYGPTHSQSLEKHFLGTPGLTVLAPVNLAFNGISNPETLLYGAILEQDTPVLFIENKLQYLLPVHSGESLSDFEVSVWQPPHSPAEVSTKFAPPAYRLEIKSAPAPRLTLVAYGYMAELARQAQLELAYEHELFTELVIPTQLAPFELGAVIDSVRRTQRVLVIEEGGKTLGWGAEVLARLVEQDDLPLKKAKRLAAKDLPVPASASLEAEVLPSLAGLVQLAKMMV